MHILTAKIKDCDSLHIMPSARQSVRNYVMIEQFSRKIEVKMINIGIVGYGNVGKACEKIALGDRDINVVGVFTRRNPRGVQAGCKKLYSASDLPKFKGKIDVLLLCVGSAFDLTDTALALAKDFNTVDSFDTHSKMAEYAQKLNSIAVDNGRLCYFGIGWDPGLFSLCRALFSSVIPNCDVQTFWGKGVSQGHSEAIRKIDGVLLAKQYTVPKENALKEAREGRGQLLSVRDKHLRECYVVAKEGANKAVIEDKIKNMPDYFAPYDTIVHFISKEEFEKEHGKSPHGGFVLASGDCCGEKCNLELSLKTQSNPHFTASVLVAYAKANAMAYQNGDRGAKSVIDIPISYLCEGEWIDKIGRFI